MSEAPNFNLPTVQNFTTGWGPSNTVEPLAAMPLQYYNKNDKLGVVSDWTNTNKYSRGMS